MNEKVYYHFEVLAKELNFTSAAQKIGISQQALSAQIARLEAYYHVKLLQRTPHLELTYAGKRLLDYSAQLNTWNAQVRGEMQEIHDAEQSQIFIGATSKRGFTIIPLLFPEFHREFPLVEVSVLEGSSSSVILDLLNGKTDFSMLVSDLGNPDVRTIPVFGEKIMLYVSDNVLKKYCSAQYDYLLSHANESLPIDIFKDCPFILNAANNRVRNKCDNLFASHNIVPRVVFSATNAMILAEIASQDIGATFLNSSTRSEYVKELHRFVIQELSEPDTLKICYLRNHHLSRPARRFIELAIDELPKRINSP